MTGYTREDWESRLPSEIAFWQSLIDGTHKNKEWVADMRRRVAGTAPFNGLFCRYLKPAGAGTTRILDVGAGPVSVICPAMAPTPITVTAIDPLADVYNDLLHNAGLEPAVRTQKGEAERLSELGIGPFDLVYSRNALDHSYDPIRAIREMVLVCAPDGVVVIEGAVNESLNAQAQGLHQWNFMPLDNGDLVIWTPDYTAYSLRAALDGMASVDARNNKWYCVEIRPLPQ